METAAAHSANDRGKRMFKAGSLGDKPRGDGLSADLGRKGRLGAFGSEEDPERFKASLFKPK
jgi:hypothetical protein